MQSFLKQSGVLVYAAFSLSNIHADVTGTEPLVRLDPYLLSAGPQSRGLSDFATPATIVEADALSREGGGSLGEALNWHPGVSASAFASGASRPILRGFDGARVRILNSAVESVDVSETSPDHGVAVEPLLTERVEILRGPATLLYGGSAIGGVVNVIGREIPRQPGTGSVEGALEFRHETVSHGETALGYAQFGTDNWALAITGLIRDHGDYKIPGRAETGDHDHEEDEDEDHEEHPGGRGKLPNSFFETDLFSIGGSWFFTNENFIGFAYSEYNSRYGVPVHGPHHEDEDDEDEDHEEHDEDVSIDLERRRFDSELQLIEPFAGIEALRVRLGYTDYTHSELEGRETGTVFRRRGWELRTEAAHAPIGVFDEGIFGIQLNDTDFSAVGEEAFTPASTTRSQAVFTSQHIHGDPLHFEFGARIERQTVAADTVASDYNAVATSFAASAIWTINSANTLALSLQRSQRHPTSTELYADGPHLATARYEIGDPDLNPETAYGVDLTWRSYHENWNATVSAFHTYFDDYVHTTYLGYETDHLDTYGFSATDARFYGVEGEIEFVLHREGATELRLALMGDYVRAEDRDSGENLPRIPPMRIGSRLSLRHSTWDFGAELRHAFQQNKTAEAENATDSYTEFNLDASKRFVTSRNHTWTLFVRAGNLLNEEIRHHTSYLKDAAPQAGRNVTLGGRFEF